MLEILDIHHTLLEPLQVKSKGVPTNEIRTKTSLPSYFQTFIFEVTILWKVIYTI